MAEAEKITVDQNPPQPPLDIMPAHGFVNPPASRATLCRTAIPAPQHNTIQAVVLLSGNLNRLKDDKVFLMEVPMMAKLPAEETRDFLR
ncbi:MULTISPECIES: hypothetical protein [Symbiopectobacterium]|uniref:hypothetical protein n=1 Tax=Symbiopectobacterium TaxID=801 RepID=UPI001A324467|nr:MULTISPECIES: hypothetical protein [Symbiopectobacterium]MBG6249122.1 hypothetical protein [Candidatus Symbiopectobacterium sp. PLON1]MBT9430551.1 hypothetical protein [Candidatus Symbiopectobacterium endolongispinus]